MNALLDGLLALVYPPRCPACTRLVAPEEGLCDRCAVSLYPLGAACPICAEPEEAPQGTLCGRCRRRPPPFARVVAPWRYGGELAVAVRRMKYGGRGGAGRADLVRPLAALLAPAVAPLLAERRFDLAVAVPLHPARLTERGFSQAHLLARLTLRLAGGVLRLDPGALVRDRPTAVQAGLRRAARVVNVRGAFRVPTRARARLSGCRLLLVDDVVTTCATAAACARALLHAGAASVEVLALARAEP